MPQFSRRLLQFRLLNYKLISSRNKYIVLLPEIPPDTAENNPLLRSCKLPPFSELTAEKCFNATGKLAIEYEANIHHLDQKLYDAGVQRNVQNVILPLDRLSGALDFAWGAFKLLYTACRKDDVAKPFIKLHPRIIRAKREKYMSTSIYHAFKELKENEKQLTEPVRRIIDKHLLESRLSGMDLSNNSYQRFLVITQEIDKYQTSYRSKLRHCTSSFKHELQFDDVRNFPPDLLQLLASDKSNYSRGPWIVTLDQPIYERFMECCEDTLLRWNIWNAYNVRASTTWGTSLNNSLNIEEIRFQRSEMAKLLGFESFAAMSMKTKMAGSIENVTEMITTLHVKSKVPMLKEVAELEEFARQNGFPGKLEVWDIPYWRRRHQEAVFNIDDAVVRQFFPLPVVLDGIFKFCNKLFNITIKESNESVDVWHKDVKYYMILDETGKEVASFFLDPYLRHPEKSPGSWIEIGKNRSDVIGAEPLSYLVFNFQPPVFDQPSLLSFDDLKCLLGKLGHLLQHSLTTVPYNEVAGLTNLEWDTVEVCPTVMRSFLRHYGTAASLSCHVESGKVLPPELHDRLVKKDCYMKNFKLTEKLYLSALDMELYTKNEFWYTVTRRLWSEYMPFPFQKQYSMPCSFPDIFCHHHQAAYFSHLWAEMIAADVFSAFEEGGLDDDENLKQIGSRFRSTFLSLGGGCHPSEVFRKFRGRDPCVDAFLASDRSADTVS